MGNQNIPKDQPEALTYACRIRKVSKYQRGNQEIPKGNQEIPKGNQ
jgi:hypothetical protein